MGDATNLIAIDCQRFIDATMFLNHSWASPLLITLCLANLWSVLGPSTLAGNSPGREQSLQDLYPGLGVMFLLVPIQWFITTRFKAIQTKLMEDKDKRIKLIDEVLGGIKVPSQHLYILGPHDIFLGVEALCMGKLFRSEYIGDKKERI